MFGRRPAAPAASPRSVAGAALLTLALLAAVTVTAVHVREAPLAAPVVRERVDYVAVPPPEAAPVPPQPVPLPNEATPAPSPPIGPTRAPVAPRSGLPTASTPPARRDSGAVRGSADRRAADAIGREVGTAARPGALSLLCQQVGAITHTDSVRRARADCPPMTAADSARAAEALATENLRSLARAAKNGLPPTQAEIDAAAREQAMTRAARPTGVPGTPPSGGFNVGLPGGGPSNAQRKRDRIVDADVTARLKRIREQGEARLRARADSVARADSIRRAAP